MTCQNRPILEFTKDNTQRQMAISWAVIPAIPQAEAKQAGRHQQLGIHGNICWL